MVVGVELLMVVVELVMVVVVELVVVEVYLCGGVTFYVPVELKECTGFPFMCPCYDLVRSATSYSAVVLWLCGITVQVSNAVYQHVLFFRVILTSVQYVCMCVCACALYK